MGKNNYKHFSGAGELTIMSTLPLFYKNVVPLSKEQHGTLSISSTEGFRFAASTNSVYIAAAEFARAAWEYPIIFGADSEGTVFPMVGLGLRNNENLYVNAEGRWNASYVPAYVRRYPFILAKVEPTSEHYTVCLDDEYPGLNANGEGNALFDDKGEQTAIVTQAIDFLKDYEKLRHATSLFCKSLVEFDLLDTMKASIEIKSGEKHALGGFQCVNREKLNALKQKNLVSLVKTGQMELIYLHLFSLNNIKGLTKKLK
jgi:hypothetical protein